MNIFRLLNMRSGTDLSSKMAGIGKTLEYDVSGKKLLRDRDLICYVSRIKARFICDRHQ